MLAEPEIDDGFADVERCRGVRVEHLQILPHPILRIIAQRSAFPCPVLVLEVDEPGGSDERAEVAGADVEIGCELRGVADEAAVVVEIAVVAVGVLGQDAVALLDAEGHAVRNRRIQAPLELALPELDRLPRHRVEEPAEGQGNRRRRDGAMAEFRDNSIQSRRARRPACALRMEPSGRTGFTNVPHGIHLSLCLYGGGCVL